MSANPDRPEAPEANEKAETEPETGQSAGLFDRLPDSRPGARSPRRPAATPPPEPEPVPAAEPEPIAAVEPEPEPEPEPQPAREQGGIQDLAWAGIAIAAEAAALGVRLANRALETLHDGDERR